MYAQKNDDLFVNLFINGSAEISIKDIPVRIYQQNNYPWNGNLTFIITPQKETAFNLLVRIPGWAQNQAVPSDLYRFENNNGRKIDIKVNGQVVAYRLQNGYAVINRVWKKNDEVQLALPMDIQRVVANEKVTEDIGKIAIQRGPIMYCAEWVDNNGKTSNIILPSNTAFSSEFKKDLLGGITVLHATVPVVIIGGNNSIATSQQTFTAIPYYSWANRGKGEMLLWFPAQVKDIELLTR
jgi:DUF1680 family protein